MKRRALIEQSLRGAGVLLLPASLWAGGKPGAGPAGPPRQKAPDLVVLDGRGTLPLAIRRESDRQGFVLTFHGQPCEGRWWLAAWQRAAYAGSHPQDVLLTFERQGKPPDGGGRYRRFLIPLCWPESSYLGTVLISPVAYCGFRIAREPVTDWHGTTLDEQLQARSGFLDRLVHENWTWPWRDVQHRLCLDPTGLARPWYRVQLDGMDWGSVWKVDTLACALPCQLTFALVPQDRHLFATTLIRVERPVVRMDPCGELPNGRLVATPDSGLQIYPAAPGAWGRGEWDGWDGEDARQMEQLLFARHRQLRLAAT